MAELVTEALATSTRVIDDGKGWSLTIGDGQDVQVTGTDNDYAQAIAFNKEGPRALAQGLATVAVAFGNRSLAEADGDLALPVALGGCCKAISYGDDEVAVAAGLSPEAHRVGRGGVAIAISTGDDDPGIVSGGEDCQLVIVYRQTAYMARVGENGIRPNTPYFIDESTGEWVEGESDSRGEYPPSQLTGSIVP